MKTLELNQMGLSSLSANEMIEFEGGLAPVAIIGLVILLCLIPLFAS